jgi:PAS domain S-box-containing protein
VSHALGEARLDEDAAMAAIARQVAAALGDACIVLKLSHDRAGLVPVAAHAPDHALELAVRRAFFPLEFHAADEGLTAKAIATGSAVRLGGSVETLVAASRPELGALLVARRVHSALVAPMRTDGEVVGAITVLRAAASPAEFDDRDAAFLQDLADRGGLAVANAELYARVSSTERRFRALADADVVGVVAGEDDRILQANDAFLRALGYSRDALERGELTVETIRPPDERDRASLLRLDGHVAPFEAAYLRADGSRMSALVAAARVESAPYRWIAVLVDITDRRTAEAEIRRHAERTRVLATCSRLLHAIDPADSDVPREVAEAAATAFGGVCRIFVGDSGGLRSVAVAQGDGAHRPVSPNTDAWLEGQRRILVTDIAYGVYERGEPVLVPEPESDPRYDAGLRAELARGPADLGSLGDLADRVALALDNARLFAAQREAEAALRTSEHQRRDILQRMLEAEETERTRIATALHDDTVQVMTASLLALDQVPAAARSGDPERVARATARARETLQQATERTRRLMFELRPAVLHDYGVVAAARVLLDETARETGARAQLDGEVGRYHLVLEEAVYRGVREALANVRKHSGASTISVTF